VIVVDASVLATALADDTDDGDLARARLRADPNLHAPHLLDAEVLSALRGQALGGSLDSRRAGQAIADLVALPIVRYPHAPFAFRVWELREVVTAYDALYVALAEALDAALLTADAPLSRASGPRCEVELLGAD
jgi:predicted nucleic acid-binding protein